MKQRKVTKLQKSNAIEEESVPAGKWKHRAIVSDYTAEYTSKHYGKAEWLNNNTLGRRITPYIVHKKYKIKVNGKNNIVPTK